MLKYSADAGKELTLSTMLIRDNYLLRNHNYSNYGIDLNETLNLSTNKLLLEESITSIQMILSNLKANSLLQISNEHRDLLFKDKTKYYTLNEKGEVVEVKYGSLLYLLNLVFI